MFFVVMVNPVACYVLLLTQGKRQVQLRKILGRRICDPVITVSILLPHPSENDRFRMLRLPLH